VAVLRRTRETVESAAGQVTESARTVATSVMVAIGLAVVALVAALIAIVVSTRGRPAHGH
jgi:hypothetical protein